jgi:predicted MFS family arabinose efflux permease
MISAPYIGKMVSRIGEKLSLQIEYLLLIIIFLLYGFVTNHYIIIILFVLDHILFSMAIALKTYFQKIADPKDIASTGGVSFAINHIAAVFLPALLGMIWDRSYDLVFFTGAVIAVVSLFLTLFVKVPASTT